MDKLKPVVKKARAFVVQKNTRRIAELKRKRGSEQQLLKNQRKIERLIQEIEELKDVNLDSFCVELLQQSAEVGPARVSFDDVGSITGRVKQKMCATKVLQGALANHCAEERRSAVGKKQKAIHVSSDSRSVSQSTGQRKQTNRMAESSDDDACDTAATEFDASVNDLEVEDDSPVLCGSNTDDDVGKEPQRTLLSTRQMKVRQKAVNRLGQRARQKLWLGRYGRKAKHLKGEKGGKIPELERSHLKGSKGGPGVHQPGGGASIATRPLSHELHPSWAAKKRQKEQSSSIDEFCGKKITFSDSD